MAQQPSAQQANAAVPAATVSVSAPPIVRRFVGIPMPPNNLLDLDRTVVVGDGNDWLGRVFFSTPMTVEQAIEFYRQDMPQYGWTELAVTQSDTSVLAYQMGDRMATIELTPHPAAGTQVQFWINPLRPRARQEAAQPAEPFPPARMIAPAEPAIGPVDGVAAAFPALRAPVSRTPVSRTPVSRIPVSRAPISRAVEQAPLPPPTSP
jgi:hypothetical protein